MNPARLPRPLRLAAYAVAVCVLLWLCLAPTDALPDAKMSDKVEHAIAWFVLTGLGLVLAPRRPRAIAGFAVGLALAIELLQMAMGFGRHGDWRDVAAGGAGTAVALAIYLLLRRRLDPARAAA